MRSEQFDFVVIGSGLAGLTYALKSAERGSVAVLTKAEVTDANTSYAQGGIAAAIGEADSWELHEQDTLIAGAGLCDPAAVRFLVQNAEGAIEWLLSLGTQFDTSTSGDIALGREGGHSRNRIVHHMDRTGWEVERAVSQAVAATPNIRIFEHAFATNLILSGGRCIGVNAVLDGLGERAFYANAVLLATGGCGKLYQHTTNPAVATADGIGLAFRVGALIQNMEFMQFHPTTLYHPQMRSFLITEAARGAGGTLRNHLGTRFMYDYDERLELAPRDIVARAMEAEMKKLNTWCLYLDLAHLPKEAIKHEFPTIYERLQTIGLEIYKDWIPVVPAQHYSCGGVKTDLEGRTSLEGLFAAGEVACTGVHGANRLASNSLLEAIVFARSAAEAELTPLGGKSSADQHIKTIREEDSVRIRRSLQKTMTDKVGIVRNNAGLEEARQAVSRLLSEYESLPKVAFSQHPAETMNLLQAAECVISGAIARHESVGLHYNTDLPNASPLNISAGAHSPATKAKV